MNIERLSWAAYTTNKPDERAKTNFLESAVWLKLLTQKPAWFPRGVVVGATSPSRISGTVTLPFESETIVHMQILTIRQ